MPLLLPWFSSLPISLAPMAGVSDKIFRQFCKERGADVLVTEFVSAEGVFRRNEPTRERLDFASGFPSFLPAFFLVAALVLAGCTAIPFTVLRRQRMSFGSWAAK